MSNKLLSALSGLALIASAGIAHAGEPLALTPEQMDGVTAAGYVYVPARIVLKTKIVIKVQIKTNLGGRTYTSRYGVRLT